jgi:hypothetical protein
MLPGNQILIQNVIVEAKNNTKNVVKNKIKKELRNS